MGSAENSADYVIIGAGSAGAVLAERLTADDKSKVLLLEAGGDDRVFSEPGQALTNFFVHIPVGFTRNINNPQIIWDYSSEPDANNSGRVFPFPRGKLLGGSSSLNGMIYTRGLPLDFNGWRQLGCEGWSWDDVYPYFQRSLGEDAQPAGSGAFVRVTRPKLKHPLTEPVLDAFASAGVPRSPDLNNVQFEGAEVIHLSQHRGFRQSTATSYLDRARRRPNLRIETRAHVTGIIIENGVAKGVNYVRGGHSQQAFAAREVILCGGTINSPQLLQLSGIGPGELLSEHGIAVVSDLPGVGANLQDHYSVAVTNRLKRGVASYNEKTTGLGLAGEVAKFVFRRDGLLTHGAGHITAYARSRPELDGPDLQMFALYVTMDFEKIAEKGRILTDHEPGLSLSTYKMRPDSRGTVLISSPDPMAPPRIVPNYLSVESDRLTAIAALRKNRQVCMQPQLAELIDHELLPGRDVHTDDELLAYARQTGSTAYHASGTCAMGPGADAVVDSRLRVRGIERLRVADASIFPRIPSANTNAAAMMVGEKAADLILADR